MNKAILRINLKCNNNCLFCHSKKEPSEEPLSTIINKINLAKQNGYDMILISGGEPTISPYFFKIINEIKKKEMQFGLITNGRMLSNHAFFEKILSNNPKEIFISLHGSNPEVHDSITRSKDSFNQVNTAIKKIKEQKIPFTINFVVNQKNLDNLSEFLVYCKKNSISRLRISNVVPLGNAEQSVENVTTDLQTISKKITETIKKNTNTQLEIMLEYFPLCFLEELAELNYHFQKDGIMGICDTDEKKYLKPDSSEQKYFEECNSCRLKGICKGNYSKYIDAFGKEKSIKSIK